MSVPDSSIASVVSRLGLEPHPEGGYFRRWYTHTPASPAPEASSPPRGCASSILYLLPRGCTSSLHTLGSDEIWLYQGGCSLTVVQISESGEVTESSVEPGAPLLVKAGALFGAYVPSSTGSNSSSAGAGEGSGEDSYALVCCVVVPAFVWSEFIMPDKKELLQRFSGNAAALAAVERLCR